MNEYNCDKVCYWIKCKNQSYKVHKVKCWKKFSVLAVNNKLQMCSKSACEVMQPPTGPKWSQIIEIIKAGTLSRSLRSQPQIAVQVYGAWW